MFGPNIDDPERVNSPSPIWLSIGPIDGIQGLRFNTEPPRPAISKFRTASNPTTRYRSGSAETQSSQRSVETPFIPRSFICLRTRRYTDSEGCSPRRVGSVNHGTPDATPASTLPAMNAPDKLHTGPFASSEGGKLKWKEPPVRVICPKL